MVNYLQSLRVCLLINSAPAPGAQMQVKLRPGLEFLWKNILHALQTDAADDPYVLSKESISEEEFPNGLDNEWGQLGFREPTYIVLPSPHILYISLHICFLSINKLYVFPW